MRIEELPADLRDLMRRIEARLMARGLSERRACLEAGLGADCIRTIRRGHPPKLETLRRLAPVLDVPLSYLTEESGSASRVAQPATDVPPLESGRLVPLELEIAAAFSERPPAAADEKRLIKAPAGLDRPEECFAALVADDSADRLFPAGSILFVRRLDRLGRRLVEGDRVVVRSFAPGSREMFETLAGMVGTTPAGEIAVFARSSNRRAPTAVIIRDAPLRGGMAEQVAPFRRRTAEIDYRPQKRDPSEIIGVVEAVKPQKRERQRRHA